MDETKISIIIPSYNEATRFSKVLDECIKIKEAGEIIFVDDGSTDDTEEKIKKYLTDKRFVYIKHKINKGKGAALKTGFKRAKNEIILFLDADLMNITSQKIRKIFNPVLTNEVDLSRGSFKLARGRVTELAVKPMMKILFPELYFDQPISGQVCAKKSFLGTIDFDSKWGVDIGILLDAISAGQRIIEVDIGKLEHKARSLEEKADMAEQVLEMMIKKAGLIQHNYKLVVFTLDNTLIKSDASEFLFDKIGKAKEFKELARDYEKDGDFKTFSKKSAMLLKGFSNEELEKICEKIRFSNYAEQVIKALKKRKYEVAIISSNFSIVCKTIAKRLGVDTIDCLDLESSDGKISGKIKASSLEKWSGDLDRSFEKAVLRIAHNHKVKQGQIVMVAHSAKCAPLFDKVGFSVAYKTADPIMREKASKTINILPEILAIIE